MGALAALTGILGTANQAGEAGNEVRAEKQARADKLRTLDVNDAYLQIAKQADQRQAESQKQALLRGKYIQIGDDLWDVEKDGGKGGWADIKKPDPMDSLRAVLASPQVDEKIRSNIMAKMPALQTEFAHDPKGFVKAVLSDVGEQQKEQRTADDKAAAAATLERNRREDKEYATKINRENMERARIERLEDRKTMATFIKGLAGQKPSPDEVRRADLAENVNENLDAIEEIVTRRPELFGPAKGLITSIRGKIGTSDEDIAALEQARDNLGRALQGAHGMRSATGVLSAGNSVLNNFRNSDKAILSAIKRARGSVQTFISDVQRKAGATAGSAPFSGSIDPAVQQYLNSIGVTDANHP